MKTQKPLFLMLALMLVVLAACSPAAPVAVAPAETQPVAKPTEVAVSQPAVQPTEPPASQSMEMEMAAEPTVANPMDMEIKPVAANFPLGKFVSVNDKAIGVKYNGDGTFEFYFGGKTPVFVGTYSIDGGRITTENPNETDPNCIGPATYLWSFDGEKLTFAQTDQDPCRGRREANADTYVLEAGVASEMNIDAGDYSYTAPETVQSGWVRVNLTNSGAEPHHVQFMRLNDGVTLQQFEEALKQGEGPAMALVQQVGGVGAIAPTGSAQAILNLTPGEYAILCFIPSPTDQMPHFTKGMIKGLAVLPSTVSTNVEPKADLTVRLKDYSFELPETLPAGEITIQVVNDGPEPHEFNILRLAEGKTSEDVFQFLTAPDGPPPFIPVGGMNGLDLGLSGYLEYNFEPGSYVAICNIPSPKAEGHPHFTLGMIKQFEVKSQNASGFPKGKFISERDKAKAYEFNNDGSFAYYLGGKDPVVTGAYQVVGKLLSVNNPNETDPACQGSATYQWSYQDGKLTFSPLGQDACRARRDSFGDTYIQAQ
jgi:hypothetical protein